MPAAVNEKDFSNRFCPGFARRQRAFETAQNQNTPVLSVPLNCQVPRSDRYGGRPLCALGGFPVGGKRPREI